MVRVQGAGRGGGRRAARCSAHGLPTEVRPRVSAADRAFFVEAVTSRILADFADLKAVFFLRDSSSEAIEQVPAGSTLAVEFADGTFKVHWGGVDDPDVTFVQSRETAAEVGRPACAPHMGWPEVQVDVTQGDAVRGKAPCTPRDLLCQK